MVSMAFGIVGIIACLCCKDVEHKMTNTVSFQSALSFCDLPLNLLTDRGVPQQHVARKTKQAQINTRYTPQSVMASRTGHHPRIHWARILMRTM